MDKKATMNLKNERQTNTYTKNKNNIDTQNIKII